MFLSCIPLFILSNLSRCLSLSGPPASLSIHGPTRKVAYDGKDSLSSGSCYEGFDHSQVSTRLLELLPGTGHEKIKCNLMNVYLSQAPGKYIAASYTWGGTARTEAIEVNGLPFRVRKNLLAFLYQARSSETSVLLWIDAVCIDQENTQERNHQVQLMQQIYEGASQVWVWLGPQYDDSEIVFQYLWLKDMYRLQPFCRKRQDALNHFVRQTLCRCDLRSVMASIFNRPYWRRTWIIQEILSAREIMVLCGQWRVGWRLLVDFCMNEDKLLREYSTLLYQLECFQMQGDLVLSVAFRLFQQTWSLPSGSAYSGVFPGTVTLEKLVEKFKATLCTDRRDKIYAFLGLASDCRGQHRLMADYSIALPVLFMNVMLFCRPDRPHHFYQILSNSLGVTMSKLADYTMDWNPWLSVQHLHFEGQIQKTHRLREGGEGSGWSAAFTVDGDAGWMRFWPFEPSLLIDTEYSLSWRPKITDMVYTARSQNSSMLLVLRRTYRSMTNDSALRMVHFGTFERLDGPPKEYVLWRLDWARQTLAKRPETILEGADELTPLWSPNPESETSDVPAKAKAAFTQQEKQQQRRHQEQAQAGSSTRVG